MYFFPASAATAKTPNISRNVASPRYPSRTASVQIATAVARMLMRDKALQKQSIQKY